VRQIDKTGVLLIFPRYCLSGTGSASQLRLLARILFFDGKKSNPGPYRPWKKPLCTVFWELVTFGQDQARFPGSVSDGEWALRERIFPQIFRRDDLRREITFSVVNDHPDLLSFKNFQEFRTQQGVRGSQSGRVQGSVPEKWGIGASTGAGLGMVWITEKGVLAGVFLQGFTA